MTDDLMDARLRAAGERWRAGNTSSADVGEPLDIGPTPRARRNHRLPWALAASAAAVVAALTVGLVFVGRGRDSTPPVETTTNGALSGTVWRLTGYDGDKPQRSTAVLAIAKGKLVADDSCSLLSAGAVTSGTKVTFSGLDVRDYRCTDAVGDGPQFDRHLDLFRGAATWHVTGTKLTLSRNGTTAHFTALPKGAVGPTADYPTLTSTDWRLVSATDAKGKQHLLDSDSGGRLRIDGTKLQASDTCNSLFGTARITGITVAITGLGQTDIGCPTSNPVPGIVDNVLNGTVQAEVGMNELRISRPGAGHLDYVWEPADSVATDSSALIGRTWRLAIVAGEPAKSTAALRFDAATAHLTGSDGCTKLDAVARISPGTMSITGIREPAATCPPDTITLDSVLSAKTTLWRIADGRLVLSGFGFQSGAIVLTTSNPATPQDTLNGTWRLTTISDGATATSVPHRTTLTVKNGAALLRDNCLGRGGTVDDTSIRFTNDNSASNFCTSVLDKTIVGSFRWLITDGQLRLTKGTTTLGFDRT